MEISHLTQSSAAPSLSRRLANFFSQHAGTSERQSDYVKTPVCIRAAPFTQWRAIVDG